MIGRREEGKIYSIFSLMVMLMREKIRTSSKKAMHNFEQGQRNWGNNLSCMLGFWMKREKKDYNV